MKSRNTQNGYKVSAPAENSSAGYDLYVLIEKGAATGSAQEGLESWEVKSEKTVIWASDT